MLASGTSKPSCTTIDRSFISNAGLVNADERIVGRNNAPNPPKPHINCPRARCIDGSNTKQTESLRPRLISSNPNVLEAIDELIPGSVNKSKTNHLGNIGVGQASFTYTKARKCKEGEILIGTDKFGHPRFKGIGPHSRLSLGQVDDKVDIYNLESNANFFGAKAYRNCGTGISIVEVASGHHFICRLEEGIYDLPEGRWVLKDPAIPLGYVEAGKTTLANQSSQRFNTARGDEDKMIQEVPGSYVNIDGIGPMLRPKHGYAAIIQTNAGELQMWRDVDSIVASAEYSAYPFSVPGARRVSFEPHFGPTPDKELMESIRLKVKNQYGNYGIIVVQVRYNFIDYCKFLMETSSKDAKGLFTEHMAQYYFQEARSRNIDFYQNLQNNQKFSKGMQQSLQNLVDKYGVGIRDLKVIKAEYKDGHALDRDSQIEGEQEHIPTIADTVAALEKGRSHKATIHKVDAAIDSLNLYSQRMEYELSTFRATQESERAQIMAAAASALEKQGALLEKIEKIQIKDRATRETEAMKFRETAKTSLAAAVEETRRDAIKSQNEIAIAAIEDGKVANIDYAAAISFSESRKTEGHRAYQEAFVRNAPLTERLKSLYSEIVLRKEPQGDGSELALERSDEEQEVIANSLKQQYQKFLEQQLHEEHLKGSEAIAQAWQTALSNTEGGLSNTDESALRERLAQVCGKPWEDAVAKLAAAVLKKTSIVDTPSGS